MYFSIIKSARNQQYYFNIKSANHEIIAQSEGYVSMQGAVNAINVIKAHAYAAPIYDHTKMTA